MNWPTWHKLGPINAILLTIPTAMSVSSFNPHSIVSYLTNLLNLARFRVGQNIAIEFSTNRGTKADWTDQINGWYNEVVNVDKKYATNFPYVFLKLIIQLKDDIFCFSSSPRKDIGHYTQIVWGTTSKIGCGLISYYDNVWQGSLPYKMYYVCNYGSAGNWLNSPIYSTGSAGTRCPSGTTPVNGLCS